mmetsp:Transcript_15080/g.21053  ORF Transcript_15080/g.21053 Transcript_15080/m.21053 type:complete len:233 (+) Transcript_15080:39-737(+)
MANSFKESTTYNIGKEQGIQVEDFELVVLVDGKPREIYMLNNMANIVPEVGAEYTVRIYNHSPKDIMCNLTVDGVESLGGWDVIVHAHDYYEFRGFSKGNGITSAFQFAPLQKKKGSSSADTSFNTTPDYRIGLLTCNVFECENLGLRENENTSFSYSPGVKKDMTKGVNDKKKCDVITGEGRQYKDHLTLSKFRYSRKGQVAALEVRYNAIGAKVPVAEIDEEFMKDIDYE